MKAALSALDALTDIQVAHNHVGKQKSRSDGGPTTSLPSLPCLEQPTHGLRSKSPTQKI